MISEPITPDEWHRIVSLPAQSRDEWGVELKAVIRAARERGDTRPVGELIPAWLRFRADFETDGGSEG